MVKDITVFVDVHASFDDDFSGIYLTQSDYDLVAAATRKNKQPTQVDFETQTSLVDVSGRHFEASEAAEPIASELVRPTASESRATIETNPLTSHADRQEASTDTELAEALSAYEGLNHPHESTNKVRVKRRETGRGVQRRRRRRRGSSFYSTSHSATRGPKPARKSHHHTNRRHPVKCSANCIYKSRLQDCFKLIRILTDLAESR